MFIRKSRITHIIKREIQREQRRCERESRDKNKQITEKIESEKVMIEKKLKTELRQAVQEKDREISRLRHELERNHHLYQELRKREMFLSELTAEIEGVVELMGVKIQESMQPFFRARSKVEGIKRRSDRKHDRVESILTAVK